MAMQRFYFSIKKNIIQFIYPSYGIDIGINTNEGKMIKYPQVFEENNGFKPNPSILDLLFNIGKYGTELLE